LGWPEIKYELEKRGLSFATLAARARVSRQAFSKVKKWTSAPAQQAIADALGMQPEQIWPERYRRNGARR
jgi:Ner family transcriptional regulator